MAARGVFAERIAESLDPFARMPLTAGNRVELLVSAVQFFPSLVQAIGAAQRSVHLETYILADDATGRSVMDALAAAAARGVDVRILVDGFGGGEFGRRLAGGQAPPGVAVRIYRPERWWRVRRRLLRRLHRKIAVIDNTLAYIGGINVVDEPREDEFTGEAIGPRFDFAVRCEGPVVASVSHAVRRLWWAVGVANFGDLSEPLPERARIPPPQPAGVRAALALRDNLRHRHVIEHSYLAAIRGARREVLLACAYFLPGRRMRRALVRAARRGVRVRLLLQGRIEYRLQHFAQRAMYGQLLSAGVEIHEYRPSYLHAKVAVVDEDWATVGSSNLDPVSLLLAREANVIVRDRTFAAALRAVVQTALREDARQLDAEVYARRSRAQRVTDWIAYGLVRVATVVLARGNNY